MINIDLLTPGEIITEISGNFKKIRKRKRISQKELSKRSGVSLGSLRRFEQSGEISLSSLAKLAIILNLDDEMTDLFSSVPYDSIEEVLNEQKKD